MNLPTEQQLQEIEGWIDDLLSGKYKQGRYVLKTRNGTYCCIGVACERAGVVNIENQATSTHQIMDFVYGINTSLAEEPEDNRFSYTGECASLAAMNDSGSTFEEIAALLFDYVNIVRLANAET
jgi:hypothetical protein